MNSTEPSGADRAAPLATGRGIRIRDHRGRWVRMLALPEATLPGLASRAIPPKVWDRIDARAWWIVELTAAQKVGCAMVLALVFLVLVPTMLRLVIGWGRGILLLDVVSILGLVLVLPRLAVRWQQWQTAGRVVEVFLAEGRCPACGYDLTGCAIADDRCTVCPECGAAWRMPATADGEEPPP